MVANQIDQPKKRVVPTEEGEKLAKAHRTMYFERSAAIPTESIGSIFADTYRAVLAERKSRRDSDSTIADPFDKMELKDINTRRMSRSLDSNEFIKLVL